jgi:hypothetical protein
MTIDIDRARAIVSCCKYVVWGNIFSALLQAALERSSSKGRNDQ